MRLPWPWCLAGLLNLFRFVQQKVSLGVLVMQSAAKPNAEHSKKKDHGREATGLKLWKRWFSTSITSFNRWTGISYGFRWIRAFETPNETHPPEGYRLQLMKLVHMVLLFATSGHLQRKTWAEGVFLCQRLDFLAVEVGANKNKREVLATVAKIPCGKF